jgi:hypothetical protein
MGDCHASTIVARKVWRPSSDRNLFRAFTPRAHLHLKRIVAEFYSKVFQWDIDKNRNFGVLFAKACIAHYRKLPVNWAQLAMELYARTSNFKPHPRWCTLHEEDDNHNSLKEHN